MTDKPINPYRKQAVDWLRDFADLAEGKPVNGVAGDPDGDPRVARALRIAAQQISGLPEPPHSDNAEASAAPEPQTALERSTDAEAAPEATQSEAKQSGDLVQQIAIKSDEELDRALAASVPPESGLDEEA